MVVPGLAVAEIDLHHADAALDQPRGDQTAAAELAVAVSLPRASLSFAMIESLRGLGSACG